jgi:hypothetical protein
MSESNRERLQTLLDDSSHSDIKLRQALENSEDKFNILTQVDREDETVFTTHFQKPSDFVIEKHQELRACDVMMVYDQSHKLIYSTK